MKDLDIIDSRAIDFYSRSLRALQAAGIEFLVGGAFAFRYYTGITRHTKDFDIFVRRRDAERTLQALADSGLHTNMSFPHWLGKAFEGEYFIDVIFGSGNGVAAVDDLWFDRAIPGEVLGISLGLCPVEEMIWSKSFVAERERYDGADVAHILWERATQLDWRHLLWRFGQHWRVLFSHLVLFGFIYPSRRDQIPSWVMHELVGRIVEETNSPAPADDHCFGTLLSREQYLLDVNQRGYRDARKKPEGTMSTAEIDHWTAAIADDRH